MNGRWFEENWVNHDEEDEPHQKNKARPLQQKRRDLVQQLEGADGFELLSVCTIEIAKVPFVKISRTKNGKMLKDQKVADDLTAFLHVRAGLGFYFQLYYSSSDMVAPLLEYKYERFLSESPGSLTAVIRSRANDQLFVLKLLHKSTARSVTEEMRLYASATASAHVMSLHQRGASSTKVCFVIEEHCEDTLRSRVDIEGVNDDELFWRWSSQIARGVADIHRAGIIHLAIKPETIRLTPNQDVRLGGFHNDICKR